MVISNLKIGTSYFFYPLSGICERKYTLPNQIEAALAYSQKKPLLIIHDKGISRGIFDRGALTGFIHESDFNDEKWYTKKEIMGALLSWKKLFAK